MKAVHRESFQIRSYEVDPLGRLQIPILCRLLQEVATTHASMLGVAVETLLERGTAWVLSRLHLTLDRWPRSGDELLIETWPEAMSRLVVERRFALATPDGDPLASASTLWVILDLERRRPVRLPSDAWNRFHDHEIGSEPVKAGKLAVPDPFDRELGFTVRRSDVDLAGHANNTSFVEWVMEAVPDEIWSGHDLAELDIRFLAECHQGEIVHSRSQIIPSGEAREILHQIVRTGDETEVARALTTWRKTADSK
jgi:acyl-ACP thioesterase